MSAHQFSLMDWEGRIVAPRAAEGVRRAGVVGGRLDPALLRWAAAHVGVEVLKADLWLAINAEVRCEPDSPRRRLDVLAAEGHLTLGTPSKLGHVLVLAVRG